MFAAKTIRASAVQQLWRAQPHVARRHSGSQTSRSIPGLSPQQHQASPTTARSPVRTALQMRKLRAAECHIVSLDVFASKCVAAHAVKYTHTHTHTRSSDGVCDQCVTRGPASKRCRVKMHQVTHGSAKCGFRLKHVPSNNKSLVRFRWDTFVAQADRLVEALILKSI